MPGIDPIQLAERIEALLSNGADGDKRATFEQVGEAIRQVGGDDVANDDDLADAIASILEERDWQLSISLPEALDARTVGPSDPVTTEYLTEATAVLDRLDAAPLGQRVYLSAEEERRLLEIAGRGQRAEALLKQTSAADPSWGAWKRAATLGRNAESELLSRNIRFVWKVIGETFPNAFGSGRSLEPEDLLQEGCVGFLRAIRRFDTSRDTRLLTYASWWIRQAIGRAIDDKEEAIRLPVHLRDSLRKLAKARRRWERDNDSRAPSAEDLVQLSGLTERRVKSLLSLAMVVRPPSEAAPEEESEPPLDRVPASDENRPDVLVERTLRDEAVRRVVQQIGLKERDLDVISMRMGLDGGPEETLEAIGELYGLTRERIRQIESKIINRFRHPSRMVQLAELL